MLAAQHQQLHRLVGSGSEDLPRLVGRDHLVVGTVYQQNGADHPRDRRHGRDVVEAVADRFLHVVEDVAPERSLGDALVRQPAPHHRGRMRERRHAHHRRHFRPPRCHEQHGTRADRMPDEADASGVDLRTPRQPPHGVLHVLGETRQRREAVVVARTVTAGIDEQRGEAGIAERSRERQHHRRIAAPAVQHDHARTWKRRSGRRGDQPAMQPASIRGVDTHRFERQTIIGRRAIVRNTWCREARADTPPQHAAKQPDAGDGGRDEGQRLREGGHVSRRASCDQRASRGTQDLLCRRGRREGAVQRGHERLVHLRRRHRFAGEREQARRAGVMREPAREAEASALPSSAILPPGKASFCI